MKLSKIAMVIGLTVVIPAVASNAQASVYLDGLRAIYEIYLGKEDFNADWPIDGGWGLPQYPTAYTKYYEEKNGQIYSGTFLTEPTVYDLFAGQERSWSAAHASNCPRSSAFQRMPIVSTPTEYVSYFSYGDFFNIRSFTVQQNVPAEFRAKTHGGLTAILTDSFYFWYFGDGMRLMSTDGDNEYATHTYPFLGTYTLSSLVYTESYYIGVTIGGGFDEDFAVGDTNMGFDAKIHGTAYLEGCDIAEVNVVPNNRPTAVASGYETNKNSNNTRFVFKGNNSSDPDGNPLTYTWNYNGNVYSGSTALISFPNPIYGTVSKTVTLTVTDGDKSHSVNKTVNVTPYCYECNGEIMP